VTCGLRIAEASGLDLADYDPKDGRLVIPGKSHKERTAFAVHGAKDALDDWLTLRGDEAGPLFYRLRKGGALVSGRVSTTSLKRKLAKRGEEAGISPFTWHDMRRTAVGDLLDVGAGIVTVQRLLGHADPRTTSRYDRRPEEAKRQAVAKLHVPYRRRRG
jgi:integrase